MSGAVPRQLVVGSMRHAVTHYASTLSRELCSLTSGRAGGEVRADHFSDAPGAAAGIRNLHLQFTDRLFGETPEQAAEMVEVLARSARLTVTLHDLPQPSDGAANLPRRAAAYARVAEAAAAVACNSRHEALLLEEFSRPRLAGHPPVAVLPLPVHLADAAGHAGFPGAPGALPGGDAVAHGVPAGAHAAAPVASRAARPAAAILGYYYPGKGHDDVIAAIAHAGLGLGVSALGTAAPGHEAELAEVARGALALGVEFEATGYLDDDALLARCREVAVPVAAHQHLSASASINTWIAAGRRPLIPDGRYSREMADLRPGTVTVYPDGGLASALAAALGDPSSTWLAPGTSARPDLPDTARLYIRWWEGLG
ncbi:hypothetical protein C5B96_16725 [Subtercola sp. Z020]|uniref:hypothetical protein n=1 Tax=Subtercola sp. Z020 TaxID=2080582 RepID=UPI000CE8F1C7|nr:hypothetical protein [Subtercola sp. Z020]PPF75445.1 hypothetical protein C5B96_16725 [Subtercola sp. Z020]